MSIIIVDQIEPNEGSNLTLKGNIDTTGSFMGIDFESMTDLDPLDPDLTGKNCLTQLYVKDLFGCDYGDPSGPAKTPVLNIRTNVIAHSNVTADYFYGDGRYLTNLPAFTGNSSSDCINVLWVGDIKGCNGQLEIWADDVAFLNANGGNYGNVYGNFIGNGSGLTNINYLFTGNTISDCINELWVNNINSCNGTLSLSGNVNVSGSVSATTYYGDGSNLTGINASGPFTGNTINDCIDEFWVNNINSCTGTLSMSGNVNVSGVLTATTVSATTYYGDGSNLTGINAGGQFTGNTINDCIDEFWVNNINACNGTLDINGNVNVDGAITATTVSATTYYGDGSNLTGINGGTIIQNITINGGDILRFRDFETSGNTVGVGTSRTLASLGYTNASAANDYPLTAVRWGGIDVNTIDYDTVCIQEAFETLRYGTNRIRKLGAGNGFFIISGHEIIIPSYKTAGVTYDNNSQMFDFDGEACNFRVDGGLQYGFTSLINDQTEADNFCIDNRWRFGNFRMRGTTGTGTAIRFGATRSALIEQIEINNFETGIQAGFLLNALYSNIATTNCSVQGMLIDKGWWTNAEYSSAGNQPMFQNCRFRTVDVDQIGCKVIGADSTVFQRCTVEGTNGLYGIYIDLSVTSVAKNASIEMLHAEIGSNGTYANAIIGVKGADPFTFYGSQLFWQGTSPVVLIESESINATNRIVLRNCLHSGPWQLRQLDSAQPNPSDSNTSWDMKNVSLPGGPVDAEDVVDIVQFPNIWAANSDLPEPSRVRYEPPMA